MNLTAAASGFVVLLLSVQVIQGQDGWGVTYTSSEISAVQGLTVEMSCSYRHPSRKNGLDTTVEDSFWFTKLNGNVPVDLKADSEYAGRVQHSCHEKSCTLRITDLRESDSAVYRFRFITNQPGGSYTGSTGVTLSVTVIQGQDGWGVTYNSTEICAVQGSTVEMSCSYRYPSTINGLDTIVEESFWFAKLNGYEPVDVRTDSEYAGRVQHSCHEKSCTLRITDLRERDSAVYKFRFITNQPGGSYTGLTGVTLSVADPALQVQVRRYSDSTKAELQCHSSCRSPDQTSYVWYKNGRKIRAEASSSYSGNLNSADSYSCAVNGREDSLSPPVYTPKLPSVSVSPSAEIVEGSSATLTCSSDANPAAKYTWYKTNVNLKPLSEEPQLVFSSIQSSDSGEYYCTAENELGRRTSGSTSVYVTYAPKLPSVSVSPSAKIVEGTSVTLTCSSDANPAAKYTWYKTNVNLKPLSEEPQLIFRSIQSSDSGKYYCTAENELGRTSESISVYVTYAPKLPSVSVSPSAKIVEGTSVTLTCSSDANPAAKYTWYKTNVKLKPLSEEPQLVFRSIQSSDTGEYYCAAKNKLGRRTSRYIPVSVKYAPKRPSVSVSPSAEIVESSSVTLTCSSDANPAAKYTWYKENQKVLQGPTGVYHFTSISSEDKGIYYCMAENQYGSIYSSSLFVDVVYAPKLPSVSVSPSAEIVEGSSVNLTCSSDANPAAKYTWYKENDDSPKASGQMFTITNISAEHSGNYYCEAQNRRGSHNSTLHLIVVAVSPFWNSTMIISIVRLTLAVMLPIPLLLFCLWMRKKKTLSSTTEPNEPVETVELEAEPVYVNVPPVNGDTAACSSYRSSQTRGDSPGWKQREVQQ